MKAQKYMWSVTKGEKERSKKGFQWGEKRLAIQQKIMLKEWPKKLHKNQTKTKIKTATWVTLRNEQAPELDVAGREDSKAADKPASDEDRVTGALGTAVSAEWKGHQPNWRWSSMELQAIAVKRHVWWTQRWRKNMGLAALPVLEWSPRWYIS